MWLEWRDSEQLEREESRTAANKPRDQFISRLLTRLKQQQQQQNQGPSHASQSQSQLGQNGGDEEPEESWENLAGLEIGDGGGDQVEDKSGKREKREGSAALEASRELFKKLKMSSLSQKLQVCTYAENHYIYAAGKSYSFSNPNSKFSVLTLHTVFSKRCPEWWCSVWRHNIVMYSGTVPQHN